VATDELDEDDEVCHDEQINIKCLLLDIFIRRNMKDHADIRRHKWYVGRIEGDRVHYWYHKSDDEKIMAFDTPQEALDAFIAGNKECEFQ
jgi:hypothetical protein